MTCWCKNGRTCHLTKGRIADGQTRGGGEGRARGHKEGVPAPNTTNLCGLLQNTIEKYKFLSNVVALVFSGPENFVYLFLNLGDQHLVGPIHQWFLRLLFILLREKARLYFQP